MTPERRVQFGPFEADLATGELFYHGEKLPLQEKPFEILLLLLRSPGQLVTREEIVSKVWPDVFVESDLSLNTAVRRLRASLEKADPQTELIETVGRRGYRLRADVRPSTPGVPVPLHADGSRANNDLRLAVLPFSNLDDHGRDHFSDGLTAQMIVQLGRTYKHVSVISPVTALYFSGTGKSLSHIAHRLQADYILTGTASRVPPQLRITARLIRAADQCCVWSESYTRLDMDIFVVQDEITRSIAHSLLQALPEPSVPESQATRPGVYEKYLKARFFFFKFSQNSFDRAIQLFEEVIAEDPNFAPAHAALAIMLTAAVTYGGPPHKLLYEKIQRHAALAIGLCDDIAEAHVALAWLRSLQADWAASETGFLRALEMNPSSSTAYVGYSHLLSALGRHEEAISAAKRACELDPLSAIMHTMLGFALYRARRLPQAVDCQHEAIEIDPSFCPAWGTLGFIYQEMGELDEAVHHLRDAVAHGPDTFLMKCFLARALGAAGERTEAKEILERLLEVRKTNCLPATSIALIYDALGQSAQAWAWLETGMRELDPWRIYLAVDPRFKRFWRDARFPKLLRELHLDVPPEIEASSERCKAILA